MLLVDNEKQWTQLSEKLQPSSKVLAQLYMYSFSPSPLLNIELPQLNCTDNCFPSRIQH